MLIPGKCVFAYFLDRSQRCVLWRAHQILFHSGVDNCTLSGLGGPRFSTQPQPGAKPCSFVISQKFCSPVPCWTHSGCSVQLGRLDIGDETHCPDWSPLIVSLGRQLWQDTRGSFVLGQNSWSLVWPELKGTRDPQSPRLLFYRVFEVWDALTKLPRDPCSKSHMTREESCDQGGRIHFYLFCTQGVKPSWPSLQGTTLTQTYLWHLPWSCPST